MGEPTAEPQTKSDLVPVVEPLGLTEARAAIPGFAYVGTTVVAGPEFINKVVEAVGDGFGLKTSNTQQTLEEIASGQKPADAIDKLIAEVPEGERPRGWPGESIRATAFVQDFIRAVVATEARRKGLPMPTLWFKILMVADKTYTVMDLDRHKKNFMEMAFDRGGGEKGGVPPYSGGVLDGLYPQGGRFKVEDDTHLALGSFETRLAAIVYETRTMVFDDMSLSSREIEIGVGSQENYPEGRIYTVVKYKPTSRFEGSEE